MKIFSGMGPNIDLQVILVGNIDTDLRSEFIEKGINQTLHKVYLQVDCNANIITSMETMNTHISNQVLLLENVIIGKIPESYYNLNGLNGYTDAMEVIN